MSSVAPSGNNLTTIAFKDFLGLATINIYILLLLLLQRYDSIAFHDKRCILGLALCRFCRDLTSLALGEEIGCGYWPRGLFKLKVNII